ncbi:tyrosine-type recombinase/integrase [Nitrospira sp. Nam74]
MEQVNIGTSYEARTFGSFRAIYEKELRAEKLADLRRPLGIVDSLLLPRWGMLSLVALTREHGIDLILQLREDGYEEQGIRRIINTARRYVNLAMRHGLVSSNVFRGLPLQPYVPRDRIASPDELRMLLQSCSLRMGKVIALAFNVPFRQELILEASRNYVYERTDGLWYRPPKAPTIVKGRPLEIPLNKTAAEVVLGGTAHQPNVFGGWKSEKFRKSWRRLTKRAKIDDLHFHDLRRNAGSALQEARVHPEVIRLLLGHKGQDVTGIYKTFDSWRPDLRNAIEVLHQAWCDITRRDGSGNQTV